ncbi:MAG: 2-C-methyl-D-erythritol 2,4-cyclodiphosphate synthase, partial [Planctomycetota bacterium]
MTERLRIGLGADLHRLADGRTCILGGVEIESRVGPSGHSDADALFHALTDALLGAAGLPDLGSLFPDSDAEWKDKPSRHFVEEAMHRLDGMQLAPHSVDIVVQCDQPRIGPHRDEIRRSIAALLRLPPDRVNV